MIGPEGSRGEDRGGDGGDRGDEATMMDVDLPPHVPIRGDEEEGQAEEEL